MTKVAIAAETEADRYDFQRMVRCLECEVDVVDMPGNVGAVVEGIMTANTFSRQEDVKAWEQEYTTCEHVLLLQQAEARQIPTQNLGHCSSCELKENLWLCLECGNLGCGRAQFGGVGGNSHALAHKQEHGHAVAVKLGSITPEGTADVYCYACDDERLDNDLGPHLAHWGIMIADRQKTEKSLAEMNLEQNLRWEFAMTDEDGHELQKIFGAGFTGLKNLGNTCYLASSLQCLFSLSQFQDRYRLDTSEVDVEDPSQDLEVQLRKMADGLLSGRYSHPDTASSSDGSAVSYQRGLPPSMFKALVGRGHPEFSTSRQQDAFEFLLHLFKMISRCRHTASLTDPISAFRFVMEQRLQCLNCKRVRYKCDEQDNVSIPVPITPTAPDESGEVESRQTGYEAVTLKQCLDSFTASEVVELTCSACSSKAGFSKQTMFKTLPEVLVVNARRFVLINWVPTKVDVPVIVGDEAILLDDYVSHGHQADEELLPDDLPNTKPSFTANAEAMEQLTGMGFPANRCEKALYATGNADANTAMEWLFAHLDDADIDAPIAMDEASSGTPGPDPEKIEMLGAMGFGPPLARKALRETGGDMERAVEWLFSHPDDVGDIEGEGSDPAPPTEQARSEPGSSQLPANYELQSIICHKGGSIHAGYV